ncbi:hypothetical protein AALB39_19675 [Lachnospiraceae bacterium 54-53]
MAKAAIQVANGDFSVYLPPIHTTEKLDYLDVLIMDFDKMAEEYGLCRQLCECALQFKTVWEEKQIEFDADIEENVKRYNKAYF